MLDFPGKDSKELPPDLMAEVTAASSVSGNTDQINSDAQGQLVATPRSV